MNNHTPLERFEELVDLFKYWLEACRLDEMICEEKGMTVPDDVRAQREVLEEMIPEMEAAYMFCASLESDEHGMIADEDERLLDAFLLFSSRHQNEEMPSHE